MFCRRLRRLWNTSRNQAFHFLYLLLLLQCTASEPQRDRRFNTGAGSIDNNVQSILNQYLGSSSTGRSVSTSAGSRARSEHRNAGSKVRSDHSSVLDLDEHYHSVVVLNSKDRAASSKDYSVNPTKEKCSACKSKASGQGGNTNPKKDGVGQIRLFKYLQPDEIAKASEHEEVTTDRSFIPNSYFSPKPSPTAPVPQSSESRVTPSKPIPPPLPTNMSLPTASERPRRSPYGDYPHRSPLYARPNAPQYPHTSPTGFGDFGGMPEYPEEPTFNHPRYKRPPPHGGGGRRAPPQRRRLPSGRPSKPRPVPVPRPRPHSINAPRRPSRPIPIGIPAAPQYTYPKNAANIQDILNHFQTEGEAQDPQREREPYRVPPYKHPIPQATNSPDSGSMAGSMGGDFSKELHDVQTSLLKDIREFARRPNMMSGEEHSRVPPPAPAPTHSYPKRVEHKREEEDEDPFEPKPKPVRDLIRNKPVREPQESRERERHEPKKLRPRDKDERWREREESEEKPRPRPREREREREREHSDEDEHHPRDRHQLRERPRPRPKYPTHKYKDSDHGSSNSYEDRDERSRYRDRSPPSPSSSYHRSQNQNNAVVIKRPYGTYKPPEEVLEPLEMQRKPQYWSSTEREEPYRPPRPTLPSRYKYRSRPELEPVEDIVEIHTDSPYRVDLAERAAREREERERAARERERKAALHKLYLDYLEAETVVTTPAPAVNKTPMRMKIHIYPNQKSDNVAEMGAEPSQSSYTAATPPRYNYPPSYINNPGPPPVPISRGPYYGQARTGPNAYGQSTGYNSGMGMTGLSMSGMSGSGSSGGMTGISYGSGSGTGTSGTGVGTGIDKNKNLVLHLHVHRRTGLEQMEAQGSQIYTSTVKPLTYKEIFDDHLDQQQQHDQHEDLSLNHRNHPVMNHPNHSNHGNHGNHNHNQNHQHHQHQPGDPEGDKSVSMELPIQDAKIEDVLHTLLKLRQ